MSRSKTKQQPKICKIVCFDEGSATDYIQIVNGGETTTTREKASEKGAVASGDIGVKAGLAADEVKSGLVTKLVEKLTGIDFSAEATGTGGLSFNATAVAKSIVSNTVLTDFLETVGSHSDIRLFEGFAVVAIDNSLASYALMTPYLAMLRGGIFQPVTSILPSTSLTPPSRTQRGITSSWEILAMSRWFCDSTGNRSRTIIRPPICCE